VSGEVNKGGRPSLYSPELIEAICERLSKGEPMARICADEGMPTDRTIRNWMASDEAVSSALAHARDVGHDAIALQTLEIADDSRNDYIDMLADAGDEKAELARANGEVIQRSKLRVETRLKLLACWDPKRYGNKQQIEHSGKIDFASGVREARERVAKLR
jgi:hypothetical protein